MVRNVRRKLSYTQRDLAYELELSQALISRWENPEDDAQPRWPHLEAIAELADCEDVPTLIIRYGHEPEESE